MNIEIFTSWTYLMVAFAKDFQTKWLKQKTQAGL